MDTALIETLLQDHQPNHSDWQMDFAITAKAGGTPYGCYKQSLRELAARYQGVQQLQDNRELLLIEIEQFEHKQPRTELKRRKREIQLRGLRRRLQAMELSLQETCRELERFLEQAIELKQQIGELTPDVRRKLEWEYWTHRIKCLMAVDLLSRGILSANVVELLHAIPVQQRRELLGYLQGRQQVLTEWYLENAAETGTPLIEAVAEGY